MGAVVLCVPFEGHIKTKPVLVGYCNISQVVIEPYRGPHDWCDMDWCIERKQHHYYTKCLMWPCRICDHYYSNFNGLLNHECEWE